MRRLAIHQDLMTLFRRVHFIGICGVGMSGIAEVLHNLGYAVSGSDQASSWMARRLAGLGIVMHMGHEAAHIAGVDVVVISSAIKADNPELVAAREARIPVIPRAQMLGELMRFRRGIAITGTHGKTTTTSLIASVLAQADYDPTFVIGGQLKALGTHAQLGAGQYLVAEADESDGSFLLLSPVIAVVTNIDIDHLDNYHGDFAELKKAFADFLARLPFYGLAVLCMDDPEVAALTRTIGRRSITYGIHASGADVRALNLGQTGFQMNFDMQLPESEDLWPVSLNLPGQHNVLNALAAATVGWQLGVEPEAIARTLTGFQGVARRFHCRGELKLEKGRFLLIDDYAHHPREIAAVLATVRGGWPDRRIVVAFQPHRYSRTRDLMDEFTKVLTEADVLLITAVYPAGETPIPGADARALVRAVRACGKVDPVLVEQPFKLKDILPGLLRDGDLLLMLGAGDIGAVVDSLAQSGQR